jgi:hypothetical protein
MMIDTFKLNYNARRELSPSNISKSSCKLQPAFTSKPGTALPPAAHHLIAQKGLNMAKDRVKASSSESTADDSLAFDRDKLEATPSTNGEATPASSSPSAEAPDPFDPASLRLNQDFGSVVGVKKALLSVPVRKPDKSWFVRAHPDPGYCLETAVIELKEDRETYLVGSGLWTELAMESTFGPRALYTAINRQAVVFLWQIRLPGPDAKLDEWSRTALAAAERARKGWVRVAANLSLGAYDVFEASAQLAEPEWPAIPFRELLRVAFKDRFINTLDHPVLRKLRGEV